MMTSKFKFRMCHAAGLSHMIQVRNILIMLSSGKFTGAGVLAAGLEAGGEGHGGAVHSTEDADRLHAHVQLLCGRPAEAGL